MPPGIYPRPSGSTIAERLDYYSMPEPNSGCLLWVGGTFHDFGYGQLKVDGRPTCVHVLQWVRFNGPVPAGGYVCHKCDVPECIEPKHLFLGTMAANMADMRAKGRHTHGERHAFAKLTASVIPAIRTDARRHRDIAKDYGVTEGLISQVKRGLIWRHVP
jgi:hypothetical protein